MPNRRQPKAKRSPVERLLLARGLAEALERHPLVAGRAGLNLTEQSGAKGPEIKLTEPDEDLMKSLIMDLGPFIRSDEDVSLPAVMNLAIRYIDDPELVHAIESAMHQFRTSMDGIELIVNGERVTGERATNLWLNSSYFHLDSDKTAVLASYDEFAAPLVRHQFLDYVFEVTKLTIWVGSVIDEAERRGAIQSEPAEPSTAHPHPLSEAEEAE